MHKSAEDKIGIPDGLVIYWLADAVLPLGRHASISPILYPTLKMSTLLTA